MGVWVGAIKFGVRLFHHRIYTTGFAFNTLKIDGKIRNIKEGKNKVGKRGTITKVGTKITFSTNIGEEIDLIAYGYFFNAYVRSRALKVSGICSQQFIVSKFFQHPWAPKHSHLKKHHCPRRVHFTAFCKRLKLTGNKLKACVFDRCANLPKNLKKKF